MFIVRYLIGTYKGISEYKYNNVCRVYTSATVISKKVFGESARAPERDGGV